MYDIFEKLGGLFKSRRFYAAVTIAVLNIINEELKLLNESAMLRITAIISAWIIGDSLEKTGKSGLFTQFSRRFQANSSNLRSQDKE